MAESAVTQTVPAKTDACTEQRPQFVVEKWH
jgi:hypothetical protein